MQTIDINTTQNVEIQYQLAILRDRILAFAIDFFIMCGGAFLLFLFSLIVFSPENQNFGLYLMASPVIFFYTLVSELVTNGQPIGKKALKIKIVKIDGKEPHLNDYLLRWIFRPIDIYLSIGTIASLLISSSDKKQRIGDILANTAVVKILPDHQMTLEHILKISTLENHTPTYPDIRKMREEDMLVVMDLLKSFQKYPNRAHTEALVMMVERIKGILDIREVPENKKEFLTALLKDYIVLTR